jgi:peptidoglycan/LPS O-acetylase OafA/YrhL
MQSISKSPMREHHLDGLRGWASLFVLLGHLGPTFLLAGHNFSVMPFFLDGKLAVYVFFVLSGYVLSARHFRFGDRKNTVLQAIRRYPRLTIPILASCAAALVLQKFELLHNNPAGLISGSPWLASFYNFKMTTPGLFQFATWDVYVRYSEVDSYNAVLWTMPFEMLGSLLIFGMLFLAGSNRVVQAVLICGFIFWTMLEGSPLLAFSLGMAISFLTASAARHGVSIQSKVFGAMLLFGALIASLFRAFGVSPVAFSFYAAAILIAVQMTPILQRLLSTRVSKWLGSQSFPLYLTHLLVFCGLSSYMVLVLASDGELTSNMRIVIGLVTIIVSLMVAAAFEPLERLAIKISAAISNSAWALAKYEKRSNPAVSD